jgi:hypothetical protein
MNPSQFQKANPSRDRVNWKDNDWRVVLVNEVSESVFNDIFRLSRFPARAFIEVCKVRIESLFDLGLLFWEGLFIRV